MSLHTNIIGLISDYSNCINYKLLNKDIYNEVNNCESTDYWKNKYIEYLSSFKVEKIALKGNYKWKYEYMRVNKFNEWNYVYDNLDTKIFLLSNKQIIEIPKEICNMGKLEDLWLYNNKIKEIPIEIGNLINLRSMWLNNNAIKEIPKEIGNLINLQQIWLNNNEIKEIPNEIGNLNNLTQLFLQNNQIKEISEELLLKLKYINFKI